MDCWNYRHRIEYKRELSKSQRVHEYTERVEDQGWCLRDKDVEQWRAYYTQACAEDYFSRVAAKPGSYLVTVYQERPENHVHICTIRMTWPQP